MIVLSLLLALATDDAPPPEPPPADEGPSFFDDGHPGHYLEYYGAEYVAIIGAGALYASGATNGVEPLPALIGPQVSLTKPNTAVLFDKRLDDQIGLSMVREQIPALGLAAIQVALVLSNAGIDLGVRRDLHRTHALVLGGAEAVLGAVIATEALKLSVGRLRPDFRERYLRAACGGQIEKPSSLDCSSVPNDGFVVTREDVIDGMKSFPSGHASTSFALLSFLTLSLGSSYVWGEGAEMPWWTAPIAALAVTTLATGAFYVAGSRVTDHRHHIEDVMAGAALGTGIGTATWLLHFEPNGRARHRGVAIAPMPLTDGGGVAVTGSL